MRGDAARDECALPVARLSGGPKRDSGFQAVSSRERTALGETPMRVAIALAMASRTETVKSETAPAATSSPVAV